MNKKDIHKKALSLLEQKETIQSLFKGLDDNYVKEMGEKIDGMYKKTMDELFAEDEEIENGSTDRDEADKWSSDQEERLLSEHDNF